TTFGGALPGGGGPQADQTTSLYDLSTGRLLHKQTWKGQVSLPFGTFGGDLRAIAVVDDSTWQLHDPSTGAALGKPVDNGMVKPEATLDATGSTLALFNVSSLQTWNASTGEKIGRLHNFDGTAGGPTFSMDGRWLALQAIKKMVVYDARTG